ncbi:RsmD family RNA methyltransferase [Paenibacillus sp. ES5-4]
MKEKLADVGANTPYLYTFACHENEREICALELETMLLSGVEMDDSARSYVRSAIRSAPGRSPFIRGRLDIIAEKRTVSELQPIAAAIRLAEGETFKVVCLKEGDDMPDFEQARLLEREIGMCIRGTARMKHPKMTFGLIQAGGKWLFGRWTEADRDWYDHRHKPQNYSTGLPVHLARALVNIALPETENRRLLDPCCGMGTVMIEALSMGIETEGNDLNPLAVQGARVNLSHYGYDSELVALGDMNDLQGRYDAAILDMPYNLCSVLPDEEQRMMLTSLRRLSGRAVIVSTERVEHRLEQAGWRVLQHRTVRKGTFIRHVWLCSE